MCDHSEYDSYFEKCFDCGMTGQEIHEATCKVFLVDEEGYCSNCGLCLEGVTVDNN